MGDRERKARRAARDPVEALRQRLSSGEVHPEQARIAAVLGDPVARVFVRPPEGDPPGRREVGPEGETLIDDVAISGPHGVLLWLNTDVWTSTDYWARFDDFSVRYEFARRAIEAAIEAAMAQPWLLAAEAGRLRASLASRSSAAIVMQRVGLGDWHGLGSRLAHFLDDVVRGIRASRVVDDMAAGRHVDQGVSDHARDIADMCMQAIRAATLPWLLGSLGDVRPLLEGEARFHSLRSLMREPGRCNALEGPFSGWQENLDADLRSYGHGGVCVLEGMHNARRTAHVYEDPVDAWFGWIRNAQAPLWWAWGMGPNPPTSLKVVRDPKWIGVPRDIGLVLEGTKFMRSDQGEMDAWAVVVEAEEAEVKRAIRGIERSGFRPLV